MTEKQLLVREVLLLLGSQPQHLKQEGANYAAKLALQLGNTILSLSYSLERGQPQQWQHLDEEALSLFALGQQFREVGLLLWEQNPQTDTERDIELIKTRLAAIERKGFERMAAE